MKRITHLEKQIEKLEKKHEEEIITVIKRMTPSQAEPDDEVSRPQIKEELLQFKAEYLDEMEEAEEMRDISVAG